MVASTRRKVAIGIDEVGRGALAGPVVLAAVALRGRMRWTHPRLGRIRDSKQLTARGRQSWFDHLTSHPAVAWRVARVTPAVIDRMNIARAANLACYRLVKRLDGGRHRSFAWLDGGLMLPEDIPHRALVKGDERKPLIAAASIIAKVWRDGLMARLDGELPVYGFARHKGYGSVFHRRMLIRHGPSPIHRASFLRNILPPRAANGR